MNFTKMHGCANDFVVVSALDILDIAPLVAAVPQMCDRRRGIGADGVIVLLPSVQADFRMRIFNADGSEAEMCGNGIRCLTRYVQANNLSAKKALRFETGAGPIGTILHDARVSVDMGWPVLEGNRIPAGDSAEPVVAQELVVNGQTYRLSAVSMGNPHAVIFPDTLSDELVISLGEQIKAHPFFPRSVNVEFVEIMSRSEMRVRVNERGVGETLACGTGACASVVAGILEGRLDHTVTVHLLGGDLKIQWDGSPQCSVFMTGPAEFVFTGVIDEHGWDTSGSGR